MKENVLDILMYLFEHCLDADAVAFAHHLDDQAETVLLSLLRGAGVRGASGMPAIGRLGTKLLLRPLLEVSRAEILRYARAKGLSWVEDESNRNPAPARNFLRLRVTPLLEQRYPRWRQALARAARHFAEADDLLREITGVGSFHEPLHRPLSAHR